MRIRKHYYKLDGPAKKRNAEICVVPRGNRTYLWIGGDLGCYAFLSGQARLRQLIKALQDSLNAD